jgi:hypothetical protein
MKSLQLDISRLQKEIGELAQITEATPPVVTRILFSEADLRGRAFVKNLCREAGLILREDAVGNIFGKVLKKIFRRSPPAPTLTRFRTRGNTTASSACLARLRRFAR